MNYSLDNQQVLCKNNSELINIVKDIEKNLFNIEEVKILNFIEELLNDNRKTVQKLGLRLLKYREKVNKEIQRVKNMYDFDRTYINEGFLVGADEVGRGPLAGPIVAAAVVLDLNYKCDKDLILGINDSKKISSKRRQELSEIIKKKAVSYSICLIDNKEIDRKGIGWANNQVLLGAVEGIDVTPGIALSDGYKIRGVELKNEAVIKGDAQSASIACASILAKVYRDNLMFGYAKKYDVYGFENNVGYGTKEHISAIHKNGITDIHRMSFLRNII